MAGRSPRTILLPALMLLFLPVEPVFGQWLGLDWGVETRHDYELVETDDAPELRSLDTLFLRLTGAQATEGPTPRYHLSRDVGYSLQLGRVSLDEGRELIAYPGPLGVEARWEPHGRGGRWISARMGRLEITDTTGLLFVDSRALYPRQLVDGAGVGLRYPDWFATLEAGYTGLLDKDLNRLRLSAEDALEASDDGTYFGPPRVLAVANLQGDSLFWNQDAGLVTIVQEDLRGSEGDLSSYYLGPLVRGPLAGGFSHSQGLVAAYANSADSEESGVGLLYFLDLDYQVPLEQLDVAWFALRYASSGGSALVPFPVPAGPRVGSVLRRPLSDIIALQLGTEARYPVAPRGADIVPAVSTALFFVPSGSPAVEGGIEPSGSYGGFEVEISADYKIEENLSITGSAAWHFLRGAIRPAYRLLGRIAL